MGKGECGEPGRRPSCICQSQVTPGRATSLEWRDKEVRERVELENEVGM